jgi:hypothetical protein
MRENWVPLILQYHTTQTVVQPRDGLSKVDLHQGGHKMRMWPHTRLGITTRTLGSVVHVNGKVALRSTRHAAIVDDR